MRRFFCLIPSLFSLMTFACSPTPPSLAGSVKVVGNVKNVCEAKSGTVKLLISDWKSSERVDLKLKMRKGPVFVRFVNCKVELIKKCSMEGKSYAYSAVGVKSDVIATENTLELTAKIPTVVTTDLEAQYGQSKKYTIATKVVGRYSIEDLDIKDGDLVGEDCAKATHVVYGSMIGASHFVASDEPVGLAELFASKKDGKTSTVSIQRAGDLDECDKGKSSDTEPPDRCDWSINIEMMPIPPVKAASKTPAPATSSSGS